MNFLSKPVDNPRRLQRFGNPRILSYDFHIKMKGGGRMVTTIRLPDSLHRKLKEEAKSKGITLNCHILNILWGQVKGGKATGGMMK